MTANPTNKPLLPERTTITIKHSLIFPITSRQQLIDTTKILRTHYYFDKLPDQ